MKCGHAFEAPGIPDIDPDHIGRNSVEAWERGDLFYAETCVLCGRYFIVDLVGAGGLFGWRLSDPQMELVPQPEWRGPARLARVTRELAWL